MSNPSLIEVKEYNIIKFIPDWVKKFCSQAFGICLTVDKDENFMLSEIREQPEIIGKLAEYYLPVDKPVQNISLNISKKELDKLSKIYIVASGSSRNVGNVAKYVIENITCIPVDVDYASEFAHRNPSLSGTDFVIAISQSGETADTFKALEVAKVKGAHTLALTNNPESKIHKLAESKMQVGAGKEKAIAATKSFTAQLINLFALAVYLGEQKGTVTQEKAQKFKEELHEVESQLQDFLNQDKNLDKIIRKIKNVSSIVLLGRGLNFAIAQEGALKIKETSYVDANGYPAGEFLHGHMAVVDSNIPVISIIPGRNNKNNYKLAVSNLETIKEKRNPHLIIIKSIADKEIENNPLFKDADFISIPDSSEEISSVYSVIALQLFAFKLAVARGQDPNKPRSLTKAVTKE